MDGAPARASAPCGIDAQGPSLVPAVMCLLRLGGEQPQDCCVTSNNLTARPREWPVVLRILPALSSQTTHFLTPLATFV